jgi:hypothetical protein
MPLVPPPALALRPRLRGLAACFALAAASLGLPTGVAQAQDSAAAETLFREGKALVAEGKITEACPKFEASLELDRSLGTLLNLADCLEQNGELARAFVRFGEAAKLAESEGDDRAGFAKERRDALVPKVGRLSLKVTRGTEALVVQVAGRPLSDTALGLPIVVDAGKVEVFVLRERDVLEKREVDVAAGDSAELALDLAAISAAHPSTSEVKLGPPDPTQATIGIIGMGVGLAGLATFGVLEGIAFGQRAEAGGEGGCIERGDSMLCSPQGYELMQRAGDFAEVGQWVGIAGATIFAVGLTVFLTAPTEGEPIEQAPVAIAPWIGPGTAGLVIGGRL